jgi:hypothetical protein
MKNITNCAIAAITLFLFSCQKDQATFVENNQTKLQVDESQYFTPSKEYLAALEAATTPSVLKSRAACDWIEIPANSTDAIAKAVNDACAGGVIYLKAGLHTETKALTISKSVKIVGETGAILKLKSVARPANPDGSVPTEMGLRVLNAPRTLIQNIDIQPIDPIGGAAVVIENSSESAVMNCTISQHEVGIAIEKSDRAIVMRNKVTISNVWQTGAIPVAIGIVNINGTSAYIAENTVSSAVMGIFVCDKYGTCEGNTANGNLIGIILCKVPKALLIPDGKIVGAEVSCQLWKVRNNTANDNINNGYLVVDGANNNLVENNNAARNGTYDIELTTDTNRFGFLAPFSFNNTVRAGSGQKVKDCGRNNSVTGGNMVNNATDPCN